MAIPHNLLYTVDHLWVKRENDRARMGLTEYAQKEMGSILLVELPEEGSQLREGERFAVIETAKAITDLKMPFPGRVLEVNQGVEAKPELINKDPYGHGWLVTVVMDPSAVLDRLMDPGRYETYLHEEGAQ